MLLHKCCQLLMRMVSPQVVGLILLFLIGAISAALPSSSPHSPSARMTHMDHHSSSHSSHAIPRVLLSTKFGQRIGRGQTLNQNSTSPRHLTINSKESNAGNRTFDKSNDGGLDNGATDADVSVYHNELTEDEMVELPETAFSEYQSDGFRRSWNSMGQIKVKNEVMDNSHSAAVSRLEHLLNHVIKSKDAIISVKNREKEGDNKPLKLFESLRISKNINRAKAGTPILSRANSSNNTDHLAENSNIREFIKPTYSSTSLIEANQSDDLLYKSRRRGRNFPSKFGFRSRADRDTKPEESDTVTESVSSENEAINEADTGKNLFNYTYHISAVDRGSVFPHDPFETDKEFGRRSMFASPEDLSDMDTKLNLGRTSSRSDSIYMSLRPRLRPTQPSHIISKLQFKTASSDSESSTVTTPRMRMKTKIVIFRNKSDAPVTATVPIDKNSSLRCNVSSGDALDEDSSVNLPKRIDLNYSDDALLESGSAPTHRPSFPYSRKVPDATSISKNLPSVSAANDTPQEVKRHRLRLGNNRLLNNSGSMFGLNRTKIKVPIRRVSPQQKSSVTTFEVFEPNITESSEKRVTTVAMDRVPTNLPEDDSGQQESELIRKPKMTDSTNAENIALKKPRLDPKTFYDYLMKSAVSNNSYNFTVPEFRPGNFFRYDGIYPRKPVLDQAYTRPPPFFKVRTFPSYPVTAIPDTTPTTFESRRTSIRVSSTFYPNRIQDITMRFVPDIPTTTPTTFDKSHNEENPDDSEFRDAVDPGFTMEKLAYLLIGTCCGLSILCLLVVVIAIKCRRFLVEKRLKAQFRRRMYQNERMKDSSSPWQQQMFDHFMYLHSHPESSRSSANSCNCRCVTWSLGARNLEASRPIRSTDRSSLYLCGQKKLPFGAASTLRYESMLGRKSHSPPPRHTGHVNSDSSPENDSLEQDSDSRDSEGSPRHCTCINYTMWPMPSDVRRGMYGSCPAPGHYVVGDCAKHHSDDVRVIPRDCPPPVTGSNYLDRSEGVVYWSSNDERLI